MLLLARRAFAYITLNLKWTGKTWKTQNWKFSNARKTLAEKTWYLSNEITSKRNFPFMLQKVLFLFPERKYFWKKLDTLSNGKEYLEVFLCHNPQPWTSHVSNNAFQTLSLVTRSAQKQILSPKAEKLFLLHTSTWK